MKTTLFFIATMIAASSQLSAQSLVWAKSIGGSFIDQGNAIATDPSGNVYTTGVFHHSVDFDPGSGTTPLHSSGNRDVFVQKMTSSGKMLWAHSFGGSGNDVGQSIAADAVGSVYTKGYFNGTVDFDPGPGNESITSTAFFGDEIFIHKMDASGNFDWVKTIEASSSGSHSLVVDASGNVYITGHFRREIDFDPGPGTVLIDPGSSRDAFVLKLDISGDFLWVKTWGGSSSVEGLALDVDGQGNVYTTGYFKGTADFDPGAGSAQLTAAGHDDVFVQKLDASGNFIWAKAFGGSKADRGVSISVNASGEVYTTGYFYDTADFDPGSGTSSFTSKGLDDVYIHKMDASGNFVWVKIFGGPSNDSGLAIEVDDVGNVITTGYTFGAVDFDPGAEVVSPPSFGNRDAFVHKLDASGNFVWVQSFGNKDDDQGEGIAINPTGYLYSTGHFKRTVDVDMGPGIVELTSEGYDDIFIQKMNLNSGSSTNSLEDFEGRGIRLKAYPNPTEGKIRLTFNQTIDQLVLVLRDIHGLEMVRQYHEHASELDLEFEGDCGLYFLTVQLPEGQKTLKLIKQ
ncbi:SBBP repeat-containing protein [bacterium SCSIO 12741]|nr:SBBP repeat-containing protein [bacterium SCSIO 12741]